MDNSCPITLLKIIHTKSRLVRDGGKKLKINKEIFSKAAYDQFF